MSLGALDGAALGEDLDKLVTADQITVYRQSSLADLFKMLDVGRVDVVMGNGEVAADALADAFFSRGDRAFQVVGKRQRPLGLPRNRFQEHRKR